MEVRERKVLIDFFPQISDPALCRKHKFLPQTVLDLGRELQKD